MNVKYLQNFQNCIYLNEINYDEKSASMILSILKRERDFANVLDR
jgi:hypothetical protein